MTTFIDDLDRHAGAPVQDLIQSCKAPVLASRGVEGGGRVPLEHRETHDVCDGSTAIPRGGDRLNRDMKLTPTKDG